MDERAEAEANDAIDRPEDEDHARPLRLREQLAEAEDHAAFVLRKDLDRCNQVEGDDDAEDERWRNGNHANSP